MGRRQQRIDEVTQALVGFQVGMRVRVTDTRSSVLSPLFKGQVVTLLAVEGWRRGNGIKIWTISTPKSLTKMGVGDGYWCQENCMEVVGWDKKHALPK